MSTINAIRNFIITCPYLDNEAIVNIDLIGNNPIEYSINLLPGEKIIKTFIDESTERTCSFTFNTREYNEDVLQSLENQGFYEKFADWLELQSKAGILPELGTGKTAKKIEATNWGYLFLQDTSQVSGVYQITCLLTYRQEA